MTHSCWKKEERQKHGFPHLIREYAFRTKEVQLSASYSKEPAAERSLCCQHFFLLLLVIRVKVSHCQNVRYFKDFFSMFFKVSVFLYLLLYLFQCQDRSLRLQTVKRSLVYHVLTSTFHGALVGPTPPLSLTFFTLLCSHLTLASLILDPGLLHFHLHSCPSQGGVVLEIKTGKKKMICLLASAGLVEVLELAAFLTCHSCHSSPDSTMLLPFPLLLGGGRADH